MVDGPEARDGAAFAQSLSALKERGSNLLVVGGLHEGAQVDACDRLLGDHPERPRRRVFVRTDGSTRPHPHGDPQLDGDHTRVVQRSTTTRSAAATAGGGSSSYPTHTVPEDDLGALARSVTDAIDELEPAEGFDPGDLRVCVDSLVPLFSQHDEEVVVRSLSLVTRSVRDVDGMAHYHLPVSRGRRAVRLLEPLFDAVIEVRLRDGEPEHSWSLTERDVETGWLPL